MKMNIKIIIGIVLILLCVTVFAENTDKAASEDSDSIKKSPESIGFFSIAVIGCCIGLGLAAMGGAIGQGIAISKGLEGISRQPEASGKIQTVLLIGLAFIESVVIYVLVVVLIILFADPFLQFIR